ncbi:MAG: TipAS antibiotic-recognition domain-containing protein [Clostridia bacterium]
MEEKELINQIESTDQYKEMMKKAEGYTKEEWEAINKKQLDIILVFVMCKNSGEEFNGVNTQKTVATFQDYITSFYYNCTTKELRGIAQMYEIESDFRKSVNEVSEGAADFIAKAIKFYCDTH